MVLTDSGGIQKEAPSTKDQLYDLLPSLCVAFAVAIPVYGLSFIPLNSFVLLPIQILTGCIIAYLVVEKSQLEEYKELKQIAMPIMRKIPVVNKVIK